MVHSSPQEHGENMYLGFEERLSTFKNETQIMFDTEALARNGLYLQVIADKSLVHCLKCAYCRYTCYIANGHTLNNRYRCPISEHRSQIPKCAVFPKIDDHQNCNDKDIIDLESIKSVLNRTQNAVLDKPLNPAYSTEQTRMMSYQQWPKHVGQQPDVLSKAGFYYYGMKDMVKYDILSRSSSGYCHSF